jgi:error-prone DNA polymerase
MTANVITYRSRSATREVGKVLGLDQALIDRLAKLMHRFEYTDSSETLARHLGESVWMRPSRACASSPTSGTACRIAAPPRSAQRRHGDLSGPPRRRGAARERQHARSRGGAVDKEDCADMGLIKVDLLGLGMMAVLQDALALINSSEGTVPLRRRGQSPRSSREQSPSHRGDSPVDLAHLP